MMPFTHRIEPEHRLITVAGIGSGTIRDAEEVFAALLQDPLIRPNYGLLILASGVDPLVTMDALSQYVGLYRSFREYHQGRVAVVDEHVGRVTTELFRLMTEGVRVFRDEDEARAWLGTPTRRLHR